MDTQDVIELFEEETAGQYLDFGTFYTGTEDTLFSADDAGADKPVTRTFKADEDTIGLLVEYQLKINDLNLEIEEISAKAKRISSRLDLAKKDYSQRLDPDKYNRALTRMVELVGSKKLGKDGRLQVLVRMRRELVSERDSAIADDRSAAWAGWYQIEDPEEFYQEYLEGDDVKYYDAEEFDTQFHLYANQEFDVLGDEHVLDTIRGEGLVWQDQPLLNENPNVSGFWDWKKWKKIDNQTAEMKQMGECPFDLNE
jgi:hypothetical protein